jgi:hypothetical protein
MNRATYRVELHHDGEILVLGHMLEARPHFRTLDPYLSQLTRNGMAGWLLLVDEQSDKVVARRRVEPLSAHTPQVTGSR